MRNVKEKVMLTLALKERTFFSMWGRRKSLCVGFIFCQRIWDMFDLKNERGWGSYHWRRLMVSLQQTEVGSVVMPLPPGGGDWLGATFTMQPFRPGYSAVKSVLILLLGISCFLLWAPGSSCFIPWEWPGYNHISLCLSSQPSHQIPCLESCLRLPRV